MAPTVVVRRSRDCATTVERAFDEVLRYPLPRIFVAKFGPIPAVVGVRDQDGEWSCVGQTRIIELGDGSQMREELQTVTPGSSFSYELTDLTGPFRRLVCSIDGRWEFTPSFSGGATVTWSWALHARSTVTGPLVHLVGLIWGGYARRSLDTIARLLQA